MSSSDDKKLQDTTPEEERQAEALSRSLERGGDSFAGLLSAAVRPGDLDADVHERILMQALEKMPLVTSVTAADEPRATPREIADADRLREALDADPRGDAPTHPLADLARATRHAHAPRPISEIRNEALLRPALRAPSRAQTRRFFGVTIAGALAAAAALFVWVQDAPDRQPAATAPADPFLPGMVEKRSTTELFEREDFPQTGGETSRIDRITTSRQSDLRNNRFVAWGVP